MAITIKFSDGSQKTVRGDSVVRMGGLMVIRHWNKKRRTYESGECFDADSVAWAQDGDQHIVVGAGRVTIASADGNSEAKP
jgi:hypothetical protein